MRVYWPMGNRNHTVVCTPANDPDGAGVSDFLDAFGKPLKFTVEFVAGVASNLPDALGRYLVAKGLANKTPVIAPKDARAVAEEAMMQERVRTMRHLTGTTA
jgi:hypothetical protein